MSSESDLARDMQFLEHNLQHVLMQKQSVHLELNEVLNALNEIESTNDEIYKVVGPVMVRADKSKLRVELEEKKKILEMRLSSIEKQEEILNSRIIDARKNSVDARKS